jgi:tRNA A58 N-methylase Trm61
MTGVLARTVAAAEHRITREVRNSGDAAAVAAWLGQSTPPLGGWAIEADFARLVASELSRAPETVVECGSGTTTLLIARLLERNRRGSLFSLEHDHDYAERTRREVEAAGLGHRCRVMWAPLASQQFGELTVDWYDAARVAELPDAIDVLVVDGPPSLTPWARWPAVEALHDRLSLGATVLLDDGRRRDERRTVFRWRAEHTDLELHWYDTVKGTWRLARSDAAEPSSRAISAYQHVRRTLHPRPAGFGRWPVQR